MFTYFCGRKARWPVTLAERRAVSSSRGERDRQQAVAARVRRVAARGKDGEVLWRCGGGGALQCVGVARKVNVVINVHRNHKAY